VCCLQGPRLGVLATDGFWEICKRDRNFHILFEAWEDVISTQDGATASVKIKVERWATRLRTRAHQW
jgi:hypothetical protein